MVDLNKVDVGMLERHFRDAEPGLMSAVDANNANKVGVLCAGACNSLHEQKAKPGKGR